MPDEVVFVGCGTVISGADLGFYEGGSYNLATPTFALTTPIFDRRLRLLPRLTVGS